MTDSSGSTTRDTAADRCRVCRRPLSFGGYSFGDGRGNIYRKCSSGHWTPQPPPPNTALLDMGDEE